MIQLISGNIAFLLKDELLRWKNGFISKYGDIGVTHILGTDFQMQSLRDTLHSRSFFSEKKLLILEDISLSMDTIDELLEALVSKNDDTVVLIVLYQIDKRLASYKKLLKIVTDHKDYALSDSSAGLAFLQKKYGNYFEAGALEYLFELKGYKLEKTIREITKLLEVYERISKDIIREHIIPELDSSIFRLIDYLLQKNTKGFLSEVTLLLKKENFYMVSQALLSNLRNNLYIEYLKYQKLAPSQISEILSLGKKSFLTGKRHNTSFREIMQLYRSLVDFDTRMKQGKLGVSVDEDIKVRYRGVFLDYFSESRSPA